MAAKSEGVEPIEKEKLEKLKLSGVSETARELGRGSYATVVELKFRGLRCAGKKLHGFYKEVTESEKQHLLRRFTTECQLLSDLKHPNVVQFLGIHFEEVSDLPILVMELMYTTLSRCISQHRSLPTEMSYSILKDVATALCYLHGSNPPIIHRDMSANNVLLTSNMTAKLSDLGTATILNLTPAMKSYMSTCPGTIAYMPPEALTHHPEYDTDIDCFSYGILIIHILSGEWPVPDAQIQKDKSNGTNIILSEVERRDKYLTTIKQDQPAMYSLIKGCLSDKRPNAEEILGHVTDAISQHSSIENTLQLLERNQVLALRLQEADERATNLQQNFSDQLFRTAQRYDEEIVHIIENAEKRAVNDRELLESQMFEERDKYMKRTDRITAEKGELEVEMEKVKTTKTLEVTQLRGDVLKLAADIVKLKSDLSSAEELSQHQTDQISALYKAFAAKKSQLAITNEELCTKKELLSKKEKELQVLQDKAEILQKERTSSQEKLLLIQEEMEALHKRINVMHGEEETHKALLQTSKQELDIKQEEIGILQEELRHAKVKHEALKKELVHENSLNEAIRLEVDLLKTCKIPTLESNLELKEDTIKILSSQLKNAQDFVASKGKDFAASSTFKTQVKACADLPIAMSDPQCAVVNDTVYVGGGLTDTKADSKGQGEVFEYNPQENKWNTLPMCPTRRFGLAQYCGRLLTIGGIEKSNIFSRSVYSFNTSTNDWEEDLISPFTTKRFFPAVVSYRSVLAICGGVIQGGSLTDNVEVFSDGRWHTASRLPHRCALAKPVVIGDSCYLMGGYFSIDPDIPSKALISLPLSCLIPQFQGKQELTSSWELHSDEECRIMQYKSVPANCGGVLLAIGGWDQNELTSKTDILAYSFHTGMWVKMDDLPTPRSSSSATVQLQNSSIMIAGGITEANKRTKSTIALSFVF